MSKGDRSPGGVYIYDEALIRAINVAIATGPLFCFLVLQAPVNRRWLSILPTL